ncbi:MAG: hypothetical protein ACK53Y_25560, partial [bacterium]
VGTPLPRSTACILRGIDSINDWIWVRARRNSSNPRDNGQACVLIYHYGAVTFYSSKNMKPYFHAR